MSRVLLIAASLSVLLLAGCNEKCYTKTVVAGQVTCNPVPKNHDGTCPTGSLPKCP